MRIIVWTQRLIARWRLRRQLRRLAQETRTCEARAAYQETRRRIDVVARQFGVAVDGRPHQRTA